MTLPKPITLSSDDHAVLSLKLRQMLSLSSRKGTAWARLREELDRANVLPPQLMPASTVQLGSLFTVLDLDSNETDTFRLSWSQNANISEGHLSVFTPLGTAVIGFAEGEEIAWEMPGGIRRLKLLSVQPPSPATATSPLS